jgi:phytanoyl-CoA hydroxylase
MKCTPKNYEQRDRYLWTDIPNAFNEIGNRTQSEKMTELLRCWIEDGYAILPSAADRESMDSFMSEMRAALAEANQSIRMTYWDTDGHHLESAQSSKLSHNESKVLDLHDYLESAAKLSFSKPILDILQLIFDDEVIAFQSLYFEYGSGQSAHQDTAFVFTDPPMHFAASTIALEDVSSGHGELFYYPGSQKLDDFIFAGDGKAFRQDDPDSYRYSKVLETAAGESNLRRTAFLPAKGDALLWAADLIHGGEPHKHLRTRQSLVTHYCPLRASIPYVRHSGRTPRQVAPGAWVVAQHGK